MQKIVIVGGGFSGMLVAVNLLRYRHQGLLHITVIEKRSPWTLGCAYSTDEHFHLLNVRAGKMSAFPDKADHFTDWLSACGYPYHAGSFVPRRIYKQYVFDVVREELERAGDKAKCSFLYREVTDIIPTEQDLVLDSGMQVPFDKLILAVGNFAPAPLALGDNGYLSHPAYYPSAWNNHLFKGLGPAANVLIIGTGLTMVDVVLRLRHNGHQGMIYALSTHGLMPQPHRESRPYSFPGLFPADWSTSLNAFKMIRRHLKKAGEQGISWHSVVDAIRPYTQDIWLNLSTAEKMKFMRHLRHLWGVARHRMPEECSTILDDLRAQQRFMIIAGRIRSIATDADQGFAVQYRDRHSGVMQALKADAIVNCMGPESNFERLADPFVRTLLQKGLIRTDPMKLGIDCTKEGVVLDRNGDPSPFLYAIGPPTKGILWEITSVPEIRSAAQNLVRLIANPRNEFNYQ